MKIEIRNRWTDKVIIAGKYSSIKECLERNRGAYLAGANLRGANLAGANLRGAYLRGANLAGADLAGAKQYYVSHDFAMELIRRHTVKDFTFKEWSVIGQIIIHRYCWDRIVKDYKKECLSIFKKLAKDGFGEYLGKIKNG